jgi:hypothetical protein
VLIATKDRQSRSTRGRATHLVANAKDTSSSLM